MKTKGSALDPKDLQAVEPEVDHNLRRATKVQPSDTASAAVTPATQYRAVTGSWDAPRSMRLVSVRTYRTSSSPMRVLRVWGRGVRRPGETTSIEYCSDRCITSRIIQLYG